MAEAAISVGGTLSPFQRMYGRASSATLLSDYFYEAPKDVDRAPVRGGENAKTPNVVELPSRAQFEAALATWLRDIRFDSLPDQMTEHDSFAALTQQGMRVVPLIAANLRRSPSFLFLALERIFGEDPVPEAAYGNLNSTVQAWLQWLQR